MSVAVVVAVIRDWAGRAYIQRRRPGQEGAGRWELPGGKVESGETNRGALRREIMEELGVRVDPGSFLGEAFYNGADGVTYRLHFYRCGVVDVDAVRACEGQEFVWTDDPGAYDIHDQDRRVLAAEGLIPPPDCCGVQREKGAGVMTTEQEFEEIARVAIRAAEHVPCMLTAFVEGLKAVEDEVRERRNLAEDEIRVARGSEGMIPR